MRIDVPVQLNVNAAPVSSGGKQPFAGLSVGDSVSAEVLSVSSDGIVLLTEQGETIHAENLANVPLQPGDQLELLISSRNDGQLSTKLVSVNGQSVSFDVDTATARLLQLGIQPTAANLNLAAILAKAGAPVNADTFQALAQALARFPDLPPETAAFAVANALPLNEQTVPILLNLTQNSAALGSLAQEMAQLAVNETGSGNISASSFQTVLMSQQPALYEAVSKNPSFAQLAESLPHLSESEAQAAISRFAASLPMPESSRNYIAHSLSQAYTAAKESPSDAKQETAVPLPTASSADPSGQTVQSAPGGNRAPLASPVLAQDLQSSQSQTGTSAAAAQSQEIQSFLEGLSRLFAKLDAGAKNGPHVSQAVERQTSTASELHSQAVRVFGADTPLSQKAEQLNTQVRLTDSFQNFAYFQLPFELNQKKQTAELYVFQQKRRGQQREDKTSSTVLVALDTENMGRVETVLRAMESQLTIEMRVQDSRVKRYLERHLEELSQNIANYKVQGIEVTFMDEPVTPQNAFALFGDLPAAPLEGINIEI